MTNEGFILSNKNRQAVLLELAAGESDAHRIAKKHHLIPRAVDQAVDDLQGEGLVATEGDGLALTEEGVRLAGGLKKTEHLG